MWRFQRVFLFLGFMAVAIFMTVPALAEFDSNRQTDWGVQTKGNSNTVGRWAALAWEVDQVGDTMFVGGNYLEVTNGSQVHSQPYFSAYDADTGAWQSWFRPQVGSAVFAMQPTPDGGLLVGGEIGTWNGDTVGSLVKIDPSTGERWPGFETRLFGGNSVVRDLKLDNDGFVYAVGSFDQATEGNGPFAVDGAVRFDPLTGAIDQTWLPTLDDGAGWGVARSKTENITYITGFFQSVNDVTNARGFVGLDDLGNVVTSRDIVPYNGCTQWAYCSQMYDVETTTQGHIWVAGVEHALYVINEADGALVRHHYTGCDPDRNDCMGRNWAGGEFQELEQIGNRMYGGCHCWHDLFSSTEVIEHRTSLGDHNTIKSVAAFDVATTDVITSFAPDLRGDAGTFAIHINPNDGCMWLAGGFSSYKTPDGGQPPSYDIVRICDEAGPGQNGPGTAPPVPTLCTVAHDAVVDPLAAGMSWTNQTGATRTIVWRQVDDRPLGWVGFVDTANPSEFATVATENSNTQFFVQHLYSGGQRSEKVPCGDAIDLRPNLTPATQCEVAVNENNEAVLQWVPGNDNVDFIVRRSVDGSTNYWRARVDDPTYTDAIEPGKTYVFTIEARDAGRTPAPATPCAPSIRIELPTPTAVVSCSAEVVAGNNISISWAESTNVDRYIVRRSTDGSPNYWRARVDSTGGAVDLNHLDSAAVGRSYAYSVTAIGTDGTVTPATSCSPSPIEISAPPVPPAVSCSVAQGPDAIEISWIHPDPANPTDVILERARIDVGTYNWRARTGATSFSDSQIESGVDYGYQVKTVGPDNRKSAPTPCV